MKWYEKTSVKQIFIGILALITVQMAVMYFQGHIPFCECGTVKLWHGALNSPEDSQHVSDWYTVSHVLHGFIFYLLIALVTRKKLPFRVALLLAVGIEVGWEILENSPIIIERYRETASLMYFGDSMLNSFFDVVAMAVGFVLARKFPVWLSLFAVIGLELALLYAIRDNLTLNIVMLIYPFEAIRNWQLGG